MRRPIAQPIAILVVVCAIAATVRLYHLGFKSYWLDEAVSLELARAPWGAFTKAIRSTEANMVLYYSLLRPWVSMGGGGEVWVRLLSCAFGVLTLPVLYVIGVRLFDVTTALLACGMLALDTGHVWASQEGRSYALLVLLTTTSWWLLLRASEKPRGPAAIAAWTLYVLVATLAVYAHFYAVLVIAAQGITLLFLPLPRAHQTGTSSQAFARVSPWVVVACSAAIAAMLWPIALFLNRPHHNIDWISNGTRGVEATFSIIGRMIAHPTSTDGFNELAVLAFAGPLAVLGSWRRPEVSEMRWRWVLPLLWLFVPILMSIAVSVALRPILDTRYLTICLPPLMLLAAAALTQLWPRWPARALIVVLLAADIASLNVYYTRLQNEDWRGVASYVLSRAQPGDYVLFFASYIRSPFNIYRNVDEAAPPQPRRMDAPPLELPRWRPLSETTAGARANATRVWVILSHNARPDCERTVDGYLRERFMTADSADFNLVRVRLYEHPRPLAADDTLQSPDINRYCY